MRNKSGKVCQPKTNVLTTEQSKQIGKRTIFIVSEMTVTARAIQGTTGLRNNSRDESSDVS